MVALKVFLQRFKLNEHLGQDVASRIMQPWSKKKMWITEIKNSGQNHLQQWFGFSLKTTTKMSQKTITICKKTPTDFIESLSCVITSLIN